ncbi:hypothetical protein AGABI1DRAFT_103295 [Agaricus bisporus var. burnettii JB137-S8]|uniref:Uncharacterized protein n=1 Tax=Agaricus bisporus var. burnettii (strain JB137-S8 / ATCC MYA-4627 / FGSC 10392) TaxID=597362 RepID=K5WW72_AGABU|nr:uncharacterized protein AGABI1DRAFT_103295 [Agaricus bisporus var. burnettii JB137-S8]EKM74817.1 hypothetical protein AGABI1DRAFT_103295 [Agaricus bisporus var. burnettii JB137-S8]
MLSPMRIPSWLFHRTHLLSLRSLLLIISILYYTILYPFSPSRVAVDWFDCQIIIISVIM